MTICIGEDCKKQANFNFIGEKAKYCATHKLDRMIDIKHKKCIYENCNKIPIFNYGGELTAKYCATHKLDRMIDIKHKKCIYENCDKRPTFNYIEESTAKYCATHKLDGMVDIVSPRCKTHLCDTIVQNDKYEGYCLYCFIHLFPDNPVSQNYKTKERATVESVLNNFDNYTWITDKKVQDGCSKRRPDMLLDLGYQILLIEIDENQHEIYECSCENKRIMQISQDLGHRSVILLRFNPDGYLKDGKKISSCWGINGNGICVVKKLKVKEWNKRLEDLNRQIEYWINPENKTNKIIETIHLFYNF